MGLIIGLLTSLPLGYVGEGGTRTIEIDVSEWLNRWPTAEIVVHVLRPDKYPYLPVTTVEDGVLKWTVQRDEVAVRGRGKAFISAINKVTGDEYKSRVVQTIIAGTIEEFESVEAGDPAKGWVQQVLDARDEAVDAARRAENAAGSGGGGTGGGGTGVTVPSYWLTHLENRAADIREAMGKAGWDKSAFLFYSDAHWSYNYKQSPAILKWLYQHTNINKTFFAGDAVDAEGDTAASMSYIWDWRTKLRGLPNHHAVVGNHDDGDTVENRWGDAYVYSFLMAPDETPHIERGGALYYFIDEPVEKTRYLFLDTASYDGMIQKDTEQQEWLKDTLLSAPDGWHIVAVSHIWRNHDSQLGDIGWSSGGQICLDMFDDYNERSGDFSACMGKVEFCVGGHLHFDADYVSDGGIPVILVDSDCISTRSGLPCTEGTISEACVSAVVADYLGGTISVIRAGRGNSRVVQLDGTGSEIVPPDEEEDENPPDVPTGNFTNVLNTAGWEDGMRYSTSQGTEVPVDGWDITGYIPATLGDTIYMANVEFIDVAGETTGGSQAKILFFDANKNYLNSSIAVSTTDKLSSDWAVQYSGNGDIIRFTCPAGYVETEVGYIRIVAHDITKYSVITVNEPIYTDGAPDYDMVAPTGNFTNKLKSAVTADGVTLYNKGYGYKNDTRIVWTTKEEVGAPGWDITGFIPAKVGDIVRFHGMEFMDMDGSAGTPRCCVWMYYEDFTYSSNTPNYSPSGLPADDWKPVYDENGDIAQLTIPESESWHIAYIRVCAHNITGASIITVNEEIDV